MDFYKKNKWLKVNKNGKCLLSSGLGDGFIEIILLKSCAGFWFYRY